MAVDSTPSGGDGGDRRRGEEPEPRGGGDGERGRSGGGGGFDPKVIAAAVLATALVVAVADYATQELDAMMALGAIGLLALLTLYLGATKRHAAEALGSGLYVAAMLLILTPFMLYIPRITLQGERIRLFAQNVSASNVTIGGSAFFQIGSYSAGTVTSGDVDSIIGLVFFLIVFMLGALGVAVLGRIAKSYGASRVQERGARRTGRPPR